MFCDFFEALLLVTFLIQLPVKPNTGRVKNNYYVTYTFYERGRF